MRTIPLRNVRGDLALRKFRSEILDRPLIVGKVELCYAGTACAVTFRPFSYT
jgi:hypothetical protein